MELWHGFLPEVHSFTSEDKARGSAPPPLPLLTAQYQGPHCDCMCQHLVAFNLTLKNTCKMGVVGAMVLSL